MGFMLTPAGCSSTELRRLPGSLDRLFESFFGSGFAPAVGTARSPRTDLVET